MERELGSLFFFPSPLRLEQTGGQIIRPSIYRVEILSINDVPVGLTMGLRIYYLYCTIIRLNVMILPCYVYFEPLHEISRVSIDLR